MKQTEKHHLLLYRRTLSLSTAAVANHLRMNDATKRQRRKSIADAPRRHFAGDGGIRPLGSRALARALVPPSEVPLVAVARRRRCRRAGQGARRSALTANTLTDHSAITASAPISLSLIASRTFLIRRRRDDRLCCKSTVSKGNRRSQYTQWRRPSRKYFSFNAWMTESLRLIRWIA